MGCGQEPVTTEPVTSVDTAEPAPAEPLTEPLSDAALLRRLTLDLNGRLPTLEELQAVEADGSALDGMVEELLYDDAFENRLADWFAEQWLSRVDDFNVGHNDYRLDDTKEYTFERAVGDEPLRLMAYIAANDLPWTEVVESDFTVVDNLLLEVWPLVQADDLPASSIASLTPARYTDNRPAGGVIMTNGQWWRYFSAPNNYNRTRAAALSRLLLCEDYLLRPISFTSSTLLDRESLNEATRTETACVGCHATLDPISSALFGFWWFDLYDVAEMTSYHAEREYLGEYYLELSPAWFGEPMDSPADLGPMISRDPRFLTCAVETAAVALWRRDVLVEDFAVLDTLTDTFEDGGMVFRDLVRALVKTEAYTAGTLLDETEDAAAERFMTRRIMSVEMMTDAVEQVTGYRWTYAGFDQMDNDSSGFRTLAGGVDGVAVGQVQRDPTLSRALVLKRLSQAAAWSIVQADLVEGEGNLLVGITAETSPEEGVFTELLISLHRQLHGTTPTQAQLDADEQLWQAVADTSGSLVAWRSVISVLIRDPAFWVY
jgi:hypothetical protein